MRFLLFDRVTRLDPGKRIEGVKNVSMTEECLRGHFERAPLFPGSLLVEAMVQLLGWLAIERHEFRLSTVLSILEDVEVAPALPPGSRIELVGELAGSNRKGSVGKASAHCDGEQVGSIGRVVYAPAPHPDPEILRARLRYYGGTP